MALNYFKVHFPLVLPQIVLRKKIYGMLKALLVLRQKLQFYIKYTAYSHVEYDKNPIVWCFLIAFQSMNSLPYSQNSSWLSFVIYSYQ